MRMTAKAQVQQRTTCARRWGLPATLTVEQWQEALSCFGGLCAYCGVREATVLEHFVPERHGGGTTAGNCVPACSICNARKSLRVDNALDAIFGVQRMGQIRAYLAARASPSDHVDPPRPLSEITGIVNLGFRMPGSIMRRAARQAVRLSEETGLEVTAQDVIRATLAKHLDPEEDEPAKSAAPVKKAKRKGP